MERVDLIFRSCFANGIKQYNRIEAATEGNRNSLS